MDQLTIQDCKRFQRDPAINPLTGHSIKLGGPTFLSLVEKCNELQRREKAPSIKHTSIARVNIHDFKSILLTELDTLRTHEIENDNYFKVRAYEKVIKGIQLIDYPILSWEDVKHVEGIGSKIEARIKEIIREGQLFRAQELRSEPRQAILEELRSLHGIGPAKAKQLYRAGIRSIEDLRRSVKTQPSLLNEAQKIGLRYAEDFRKRIPREEMNMHEDILREAIKGTSFHLDIVGSYRRGADSSGDIDVLLTLPPHVSNPSEKFFHLIQLLKQSGYLIDTLAEGPKKYMGVAAVGRKHLARRIDLFLTPREQYAYALLHSTGSDSFNIRIRNEAIEQGYSLSEHGLTSTRQNVPPPPLFYTEKELLEFLIGEYIPPSKRI